MFTVTKAAATELKKSMAHHDFDDMPLRIAAEKNPQGSVDYQMGFDEAGPGDVMIACSGIDVVIANDHKPLLSGTSLDFVEMDDGKMHFIFLNPNDPTYVPPVDNSSESHDLKSDQSDGQISGLISGQSLDDNGK